MNDLPKGLDLYSGAGGASTGYARAGFDMTGVDIAPQPRYPFQFIKADALEYLAAHGHEYDAIFASPPCQGYSNLRHLPWLRDKAYPMLLEPTIELLQQIGTPWICENVETAPLDGLVLCGQMFGLRVFRHRRFASSHLLWTPPHEQHKVVIGHGNGLNRASAPHNLGYITVAGHGRWHLAEARQALGIEWMTRAELAQSIPPAYTEFLGLQIIAILSNSLQGCAARHERRPECPQ